MKTCPQRPEESMGFPETGVTGGLCGSGHQSGSSAKAASAETSLQP